MRLTKTRKKSGRLKLTQLLLLAVAGISGAVNADELYLQNGSKIIGTLVSAEDGKVVFDTPFAGKLSITQDNIARLVTSSPVTLKTKSGDVLEQRNIDASQGQLVAIAEGEAPVMFAPGDIDLINPEPWKLGHGFKWSGLASAALEAERGNSDSDDYNMAALSTWQSLRSRYIVNGAMEFQESNGEEVSDNWDLQFKYDRFLRNPANYMGAAVKFEYDKFADLDLRTTVGPYLGRQFLDKPILTLKGEFGPVWVDEQFNDAEDDDYAGGRWDFALTSNIIGFGTTLYMQHDGTLSFDDPENLILNLVAGLRMPLIYGFETKLEAKWEYDGGAVEGVDDMDETYTFGIGYSW